MGGGGGGGNRLTSKPVFSVSTELGKPIPIEKAHKHIFGMVLLNDWSGVSIYPCYHPVSKTWLKL